MNIDDLFEAAKRSGAVIIINNLHIGNNYTYNINTERPRGICAPLDKRLHSTYRYGLDGVINHDKQEQTQYERLYASHSDWG